MTKVKKQKEVKGYAVTCPDARIGICWRPSPLWNPTPLAIFERKEEAQATAEKYNKDSMKPNYSVIKVTIKI